MILGQIQVLKQVLRNENLKICWSGIWTMSLIRDPHTARCELVRDFYYWRTNTHWAVRGSLFLTLILICWSFSTQCRVRAGLEFYPIRHEDSQLVLVMRTCNEEFWSGLHWPSFCKLLNPKRRWLNEGWTDNFIDCFIGIGALLIFTFWTV